MRERRAVLVLLALQCFVRKALGWSQEGPHQLSSRACQATFAESSDANFVCLVNVGMCPGSKPATLSWSFVSPIFRFGTPLADGEKYGIWHASDTAAQRSSLKVRGVIKDVDVGLFECVATCEGDRITKASTYRQSVDMCVINGPTGLAFCGSSPADGRCLSAFGGAVCEEACDSEENHYGGGSCRRRTPVDGGGAPRRACGGGACASSPDEVRCAGDCSSCGSDGCRPRPGDGETSCAGGAAATGGSERCCLVVIMATADDSEVARDGGAAAAAATETLGVASVQSALSGELNTSLCVAGQRADWSLGESSGLVLYYFNRSLFAGTGSGKLRYQELQFALDPNECQPDTFCFSGVHNAAKYLANRLKLTRYASWGAKVAGIGVYGLQRKCTARYKSDEPDPAAEPLLNAQHELLPADIGSIVGLALGITAGLVLVAGLSYTAVCWHRTFKTEQPEAVVEVQPAAAGTSQPMSLSTSGGTENEESQALLLKTFNRPAGQPNALHETVTENLFAATAS